ncbi:sugar phosphate isomerase/epimerase [Shigella flexneri]
MGFDGFRSRNCWSTTSKKSKRLLKETGLPVTTACGGDHGWIGDFIEERRLNGLKQIERILEALAEVGFPQCWACSDLPLTADDLAARTGTVVYLLTVKPLSGSYMINTLADARRYIVENNLEHVQIIGDFYHMNIEEDNLAQALHDNRDLLGHVDIADNHPSPAGKPAPSISTRACSNSCAPITIRVMWCMKGYCRQSAVYRDSLALLRTC